eukprot:scaffold7601_cov417-Prasinococcus_capsulatus_cf.AAC.1
MNARASRERRSRSGKLDLLYAVNQLLNGTEVVVGPTQPSRAHRDGRCGSKGQSGAPLGKWLATWGTHQAKLHVSLPSARGSSCRPADDLFVKLDGKTSRAESVDDHRSADTICDQSWSVELPLSALSKVTLEDEENNLDIRNAEHCAAPNKARTWICLHIRPYCGISFLGSRCTSLLLGLEGGMLSVQALAYLLLLACPRYSSSLRSRSPSRVALNMQLARHVLHAEKSELFGEICMADRDPWTSAPPALDNDTAGLGSPTSLPTSLKPWRASFFESARGNGFPTNSRNELRRGEDMLISRNISLQREISSKAAQRAKTWQSRFFDAFQNYRTTKPSLNSYARGATPFTSGSPQGTSRPLTVFSVSTLGAEAAPAGERKLDDVLAMMNSQWSGTQVDDTAPHTQELLEKSSDKRSSAIPKFSVGEALTDRPTTVSSEQRLQNSIRCHSDKVLPMHPSLRSGDSSSDKENVVGDKNKRPVSFKRAPKLQGEPAREQAQDTGSCTPLPASALEVGTPLREGPLSVDEQLDRLSNDICESLSPVHASDSDTSPYTIMQAQSRLAMSREERLIS